MALGTYFAAGAAAGKATPNASQMRGLVYAVKDNRDPPNTKQPVNHPLHPAGRAIRVDRTNAIEYVTAMLANRITRLTKFFGESDPAAITLVPVPSSEVTVSTIDSARFPTLRLCRALAGVGLGTVAVLATQRERVVPKTKGVRRSADQILRAFTRTPAPLPRSTTIVLVDDNVHSGKSIAAVDQLLGASRPTFAFAVAVTDAHECSDALKPRTFVIEYDDSADVFNATRVLAPPRR